MWFCVEGGYSLKVVGEAALLVQSKTHRFIFGKCIHTVGTWYIPWL